MQANLSMFNTQSDVYLRTSENQLNARRLGILIDLSMKIQRLSLREIEIVTKNMFGVSVNKNTMASLKKGLTENPSIPVLKRVTPLVFDFTHFEYTDENLVGIPIIMRMQSYGDSEKDVLLWAKKLSEMPDSDLRIDSPRRLQAILQGELPLKKVSHLRKILS